MNLFYKQLSAVLQQSLYLYTVLIFRYSIVSTILKDKRVDPSADDNYALRIACQEGFHKIVKLLLRHPNVDPTVRGNICINFASANGHWKVVRLLMQDKRSDPTAQNF